MIEELKWYDKNKLYIKNTRFYQLYNALSQDAIFLCQTLDLNPRLNLEGTSLFTSELTSLFDYYYSLNFP